MFEESPWHERFFASAWRQVQPQSFSADQSRRSAEALREMLQLESGSRLLDVPCGEGRITEHFAQWGHSITGVDRSADFLEFARQRAAARGLTIDYRQGDMWDLQLSGPFDAAFSIWSSIGYAGEDEDRRYFSRIFEALRPGGSLVVDTQCLETLLPEFEERQWYPAGEIVVAEERQFDPVSSRVLSMWTFAGPDCFDQVESSIRIYSYRELESMLSEIGFGDFESYGSMELEDFGVGSSRLVLIARRPDSTQARLS